MNIEYNGSRVETIVAQSAEDAVRKYRKQMSELDMSYCGIVVTEQLESDTILKNVYVVEAIRKDDIE